MWLEKLFGFNPGQNNVRTEIFAGITTFLTMAYILAVNPGIFSALEPQGMPNGAVFTATILAAAVGTVNDGFLRQETIRSCARYGHQCFFCLWRLSRHGP